MISLFLILIVGTSVIANPAFAGDPKATGDIVGRDGSWSNPFGHVGIWDSWNKKVLEVMPPEKGKDVIRMTSLSVFKNEGTYWGAKYGKGRRHYKVISAGLKQGKFNPQYTTTTYWREGGYKRQCVKRSWGKCKKYEWKKINAKFRCDTFVAYAYSKGIGTRLVNYTITPGKVYNSMPKTR